MVVEEEKSTNEISPLNFNRPFSAGRITLLRLPICILGVFNWIFVNNNDGSTWKGFIFFLQVTLSTIVHLCGFTTVLVFLYGFLSNGNITQSVPLPLQYVYTSQMVFPVFSACLFLAKSWNKQRKCIHMLTQHKYHMTNSKQVVSNISVMGYVLFAFGSLFIRSHFFLFPAGSTDVAFEIIKNNDLKEKFKAAPSTSIKPISVFSIICFHHSCCLFVFMLKRNLPKSIVFLTRLSKKIPFTKMDFSENLSKYFA